MTVEMLPEWMSGLDDEDLAFIKRFMGSPPARSKRSRGSTACPTPP